MVFTRVIHCSNAFIGIVLLSGKAVGGGDGDRLWTPYLTTDVVVPQDRIPTPFTTYIKRRSPYKYPAIPGFGENFKVYNLSANSKTIAETVECPILYETIHNNRLSLMLYPLFNLHQQFRPSIPSIINRLPPTFPSNP